MPRDGPGRGPAANLYRRTATASDARRIARRFRSFEDMILRFATRPDLDIFSDNEAERTIRPVKVQQRGSGGCWRTLTGLADFALVESYLSTTAKWGMPDVTSRHISGWAPRPTAAGGGHPRPLTEQAVLSAWRGRAGHLLARTGFSGSPETEGEERAGRRLGRALPVHSLPWATGATITTCLTPPPPRTSARLSMTSLVHPRRI